MAGVVRQTGPDEFFSAAQIARLQELMQRRREQPLDAAEEQELEALVAGELEASGRRAAAIADAREMPDCGSTEA